MGMFTDYLLDSMLDYEKKKDPVVPRDLTSEDRAGWANAQDARLKPPKVSTVNDVRRLIRNRNPVRWHQMQRDFKWVQKEMKRIGLNPEDARFML